MMRRRIRRILVPLALTISMFVTATPRDVGAQSSADTARQPRAVVERRFPGGRVRGTVPFVRTELFFGTAKPDGVVTDEEFHAFLDAEITPRFPDGLTLLKGDGQFTGAAGILVKEQSYLLILLYPLDGQRRSSRDIDVIRELYKDRHQQESVLRVDDPFLVWVSF